MACGGLFKRRGTGGPIPAHLVGDWAGSMPEDPACGKKGARPDAPLPKLPPGRSPASPAKFPPDGVPITDLRGRMNKIDCESPSFESTAPADI